MGDMADYYIDLALDRGESPFGTRRGRARDRNYHRAPAPTCEHCGAKGLNWQQVKGSLWRLHEGSELHVCPQSIPTAEGFEDVD